MLFEVQANMLRVLCTILHGNSLVSLIGWEPWLSFGVFDFSRSRLVFPKWTPVKRRDVRFWITLVCTKIVQPLKASCLCLLSIINKLKGLLAMPCLDKFCLNPISLALNLTKVSRTFNGYSRFNSTGSLVLEISVNNPPLIHSGVIITVTSRVGS